MDELTHLTLPSTPAYTACSVMRVITLLVVWMLLPWASVPAALLHAHAESDHQHQAHRHGPAWHTHDAGAIVAGSLDSSRRRLEPCDPAAHAVDVAPAVTTERQVADVSAAPAGMDVIPAPLRSRLPALNAEPRAHGPPGRAATPLRAPPVPTCR